MFGKSKPIRRSVAAITATLAVAVTSACSNGPSPGSEEDCGAATVGVVLSLTGDVAVYGSEEKKAIELAVEHLKEDGAFGDRDVTFKYEDEKSEQQDAVQAFERLIFQDGADIIIGAGFSSAMLAAAPVAQKAEVPVVGPATTADAIGSIGDYVFRVGLSDTTLLANSIPTMLEALDAEDAGIIYANDDDAQSNGAKVVEKTLKDLGVNIVKTATFSRGQKDVSAQATQLVNAKPDVTFVMGYQEDAGNIIATMDRLGYEGEFIGSPGANGNATIDVAGKAAEGLYVPGWWSADATNDSSKTFRKDFEAAYNATPTGYAAMAYLDTQAVADAVSIAKCANGPGLKDALHQVVLKDSLVGDFHFAKNGDAKFDPVIMEVVDGKLVTADVQP